jgi:hypothetical protein
MEASYMGDTNIQVHQAQFNLTKNRPLEWKENIVNQNFNVSTEQVDNWLSIVLEPMAGLVVAKKAKSNVLCRTSSKVETLKAITCDCYGSNTETNCFPTDSFIAGAVGILCPGESTYLVDLSGSITSDENSVSGYSCRSIFNNIYKVNLRVKILNYLKFPLTSSRKNKELFSLPTLLPSRNLLLLQ